LAAAALPLRHRSPPAAWPTSRAAWRSRRGGPCRHGPPWPGQL